MRLTALGVYGPFPRAGSACSGYVVETGETRILLDCGSGVFSRLSGVCQLDSFDAGVLSHLHFDHCSDMGVLRYAAEAGWCGEAPLRVIAPETPAEIRDPLLDSPAFALEPAEDGKQIRIGDLTVTLHRMRHPVETYGAEISDTAGKRMFYTGDTGWFEELETLVHGVDFLLADTCFTDVEAQERPDVHMSVKQACKLAKNACVRQLGCTHHFGASERLPIPLDFSPAIVVKDMGQYEV